MRLEAHLEKARRFEGTVARLVWDGDHELVIWSYMHAGTHLLNAALHTLGLTVEEEAFPSNRAGRYYVRAPHGEWAEHARPPGDLIHADMPKLEGPFPEPVNALMAALRRIEALGPRLVRGPEPFRLEVREECLQAYAAVKEACRRALAGRERGADSARPQPPDPAGPGGPGR